MTKTIETERPRWASIRDLTDDLRDWLRPGEELTAGEIIEKHMQYAYDSVDASYAPYLNRRLNRLIKYGVVEVRRVRDPETGRVLRKLWRLADVQL